MAETANQLPPTSDAVREQAQRAERVLEDWGRRTGRFLAMAVARAREEAEDVLAEAQSVRRGERD